MEVDELRVQNSELRNMVSLLEERMAKLEKILE